MWNELTSDNYTCKWYGFTNSTAVHYLFFYYLEGQRSGQKSQVFSGPYSRDGLIEIISQVNLFFYPSSCQLEQITTLLTITQFPRNVVLFAGAVL